ncbi:hypothetical protein OGAPHI_005437 [Ogataea philodendri]|uniref:Uncharacterized protein n=1 Tax=Ogataea philodendri TaxID=1378263 RepID=A0A9P8P023_9ASCO|nr:uncharacterized protein OGAPHI_005437 [Ogataea philodendri]KAH3662189.1 hypothetical protein OGAPHI_005437 [Ogataea philodendri]
MHAVSPVEVSSDCFLSRKSMSFETITIAFPNELHLATIMFANSVTFPVANLTRWTASLYWWTWSLYSTKANLYEFSSLTPYNCGSSSDSSDQCRMSNLVFGGRIHG